MRRSDSAKEEQVFHMVSYNLAAKYMLVQACDYALKSN